MKNSIKKLIDKLIMEALASQSVPSEDLEPAEKIANSQWGNVFLVGIKGESKGNIVYRVTLYNSSGPTKYLKKDAQGRWFFMDPPQNIWRPINPAYIPPPTPVSECGTDPMKGDVSDLRTMDTANVAEELHDEPSFGMGGDKGKLEDCDKAMQKISKVLSSNLKDDSEKIRYIQLFVDEYFDGKKPSKGLDEMTSSGAVFSGGPTIQTPYAFSQRGGGSKKAMDATKKIGYKPAKKGY